MYLILHKGLDFVVESPIRDFGHMTTFWIFTHVKIEHSNTEQISICLLHLKGKSVRFDFFLLL